MRRAYEGTVWRDDSLNVIAVNLGSDFCAEHEWGISGIKNKFGISNKKEGVLDKLLNPEKVGIGARMITKSTERLVQFDCDIETSTEGTSSKNSRTIFGLGLLNEWRTPEDPKSDFEYLIRGIYFEPQHEEVIGFWAESRFMFLLESKRDIDDFVEAFKKKDIAIWLGASGPFKNGGLVIAIASRLPESFIKEMEETDLDQIALNTAAKETDIHEILEEANCKYHALSPKWKDKEKKEVIFWLNPQQQDRYNWGWYGVEDLKAWAEDRGPILKEKDKADFKV